MVLTADPTALARCADDVRRTLVALAELERWLSRYRAALERRRR